MDFAEIHIDQKYHRHIIGKGGTSGELLWLVTCILKSICLLVYLQKVFCQMLAMGCMYMHNYVYIYIYIYI